MSAHWSFDDNALADMHIDLFETFGMDATVKRGTDAAVAVRVIVNRDQQQLGEYGQVVARVTTVDFMVAQWEPKQSDVLVWTDRLGTHTKKIQKPEDNDGFVVKAVLHG